MTYPAQITPRVLGNYGMVTMVLRQSWRMRHRLGPMAYREVRECIAILRHNRALLAAGAWCPAVDYFEWFAPPPGKRAPGG